MRAEFIQKLQAAEIDRKYQASSRKTSINKGLYIRKYVDTIAASGRTHGWQRCDPYFAMSCSRTLRFIAAAFL
jgi:hypothetical protein